MFILQKLNNLFYGSKYHNNYFHNCIHSYRKVENYINSYNSFFKKKVFLETTKEINHNSKISFGTSLLTAKKILKVPFRLVSNATISDIIFYETKIGSHRIIVELHFFNKKLVFFKHIFPTKTDKQLIYNYLQDKYLSSNKKVNLINNIIIDENKSFLSIENEVYLSVYYLTFKFGFYDFLVKKQQEIENRNRETENQIMNKLYDHL